MAYLLTMRVLTVDLKTNYSRICMEIKSSRDENENENEKLLVT